MTIFFGGRSVWRALLRMFTTIVVYNGVEYNGNHPKLVEPELWDAVQAMLASHANGERTREHPHFLKGSVYAPTPTARTAYRPRRRIGWGAWWRKACDGVDKE